MLVSLFLISIYTITIYEKFTTEKTISAPHVHESTHIHTPIEKPHDVPHSFQKSKYTLYHCHGIIKKVKKKSLSLV